MEHNDLIYKQIAKERQISRDTVKEVCTSMFEFVATTIERNKHEAVRLPYFGIWRVKPGRLEHLKVKTDGK
jgi:nucleoid DNA-binding protein